MLKEMRIEVAGITTSLKLDNEVFFHRLDDSYQEFRTGRSADVYIKVRLMKRGVYTGDCLKDKESLPFGLSFWGDKTIIASDEFVGNLDWTNRKGQVEINSLWPLESLGNFLRNIYTLLIYRNGGLVLHASAVVRQGMAYIFFGPSGSGKSTVARLSAPWAILNDELVVIKRVNGSYRVFGTPYWADIKTNKGINGCFEIRGLFKLIKDKEVYLKRLTQPQAVAEILSVPSVEDKLGLVKQLLERSCELLESVPCYQMHFLPEPSFWRCIDEEFSRTMSG